MCIRDSHSGGNTDERRIGECLMSIELKDVTYTYSPGTAYEIHALKNINLSIPDGQFIGVIGHTGSGKSTLIQHLNALIQPTSGTILYNCLLYTSFRCRYADSSGRNAGNEVSG